MTKRARRACENTGFVGMVDTALRKMKRKRVKRTTIRAVLEKYIYTEDMSEYGSILHQIRLAILSQLPDLHRPELTTWARELE